MKKASLLSAIALGLALMTASVAQASPTAITVQKVIRSGTVPTASQVVDITNGNKIYLLTDGMFLRLINPASATDMTITVKDQFTNPEGYSQDLTVLVARSTTVYLGPFKKSRWADGSGYLQASYVGSTQTAYECLRLPIGEQDAQTK